MNDSQLTPEDGRSIPADELGAGPAVPPDEGSRVLVADDDPVARKIIEKRLQAWGYEVVTAQSGDEALLWLKEKRTRLAILDWMMPGLNGTDLCGLVRNMRKKHYTYIILLTSRTALDDVIEGLRAGADDYMIKPVNFTELDARLQKARRIIDLEDRYSKSQKSLIKLATMDSLTGCWNRASILDFIREQIEYSQRNATPASLLMIDLDHFKDINDACGHAAGDRALKKIVLTLKNQLRSYDRLGRYGGDEMLVILPDCDSNAARKVAERMLEACREGNVGTAGEERFVTVSVGGVSTSDLKECDLDALLASADLSLYEAKRTGRNKVRMFKELEKPKPRRMK